MNSCVIIEMHKFYILKQLADGNDTYAPEYLVAVFFVITVF